MALIELNNEEVIRLYESGKTLIQVAELCGCKSTGPILRVLQKSETRVRRRGEQRPAKCHHINISYLEKIDTHAKAYWLGFICADGCIQYASKKSLGPNKLSFCLKTSDVELLYNFREAIESEHKISNRLVYDKRTENTYESSGLQISCINFVKNICRLGITEHKSFDCKYPIIDDEFHSSFIRGLFDGDGHIGLNNRVSIIATIDILDKISELLILKFNWVARKYTTVTENNEKIAKLHITKSLLRIMEWLYEFSTPETRLTRKYDIYCKLKINEKSIIS